MRLDTDCLSTSQLTILFIAAYYSLAGVNSSRPACLGVGGRVVGVWWACGGWVW